MAEIVNLRTVRKRAQRARDDADASANRAAHGRPAAERKREQARRQQAERRHEAHRIDNGDAS